MSLLSPWEIVVRGESGRNEFLRGPFALFEAHSRAKFVRNLIKHGWASISPAELIPPPSPGQGFAGDGRLRRRFRTPDMVRSGR